MFEAIKISELDPESLTLTETFVQNMLDMCQGALPESTGQEASTLAEMSTACREMLQKIKFDLSRRSIAQQAAQAARKRQPEFAKAVGRLEALLTSGHNYDALSTPNRFGDALEVARQNKLALLRDLLTRHLGSHAVHSPQVHNHNSRIRRIADYLAVFDSDALYAQDADRFVGFRRLIKSMSKDVTHKSAMSRSAQTPKGSVTDQDLALQGVAIDRLTLTGYRGFQIPYAMEFTITNSGKKARIEVPGLTGGGAPMTKHLKEFLDTFGNEASAYDAINYCRSWLWDLANIPFSQLKSSVTAKDRVSARIYGRSRLRWEFVMSQPPKTSGADYICHHIVAKGIATGINPYHT
jgi:hypothetical protein